MNTKHLTLQDDANRMTNLRRWWLFNQLYRFLDLFNHLSFVYCIFWSLRTRIKKNEEVIIDINVISIKLKRYALILDKVSSHHIIFLVLGHANLYCYYFFSRYKAAYFENFLYLLPPSQLKSPTSFVWSLKLRISFIFWDSPCTLFRHSKWVLFLTDD